MRTAIGGVLAFASGLAFGLSLRRRTEPSGPIYVYRDLPTPVVPRETVERNPADPVSVIKEQMKQDLMEQTLRVKPYSETPTNVGLETITEDQFNSYEDDFDKCTVEVFKEDLQSITVIDGETVADWQNLIGEDALEELAGQTSIFIRNHTNNTDYEVTWGRP